MKLKILISVLMFGFFIFLNIQNAQASTADHGLDQGYVVNVATDEEGTNLILKQGNQFKSIYLPRSQQNSEIAEQALKAQKQNTVFKIKSAPKAQSLPKLQDI